jgi:SAM-dependent methyltransferase
MFKEKISILCPTRNRVDDLEKFVTSVYETAEFKDLLEFIFYIDDDDENSVLKCEELSNRNKYFFKVIVGERIRLMSDMWNKCSEQATGKIMFVGSDDIICRTKNWDTVVRDEFDKFDDKIVFVFGSDGIKSGPKNKNPATPHGYGTSYFLHKNWVDVVGYIDPPYFSADFADIWMNDIAQRIGRGVWIDVYMEHMHPGVGKGEWDSTHNERLQRLHEDDNTGIYKSKEDERITDSNKLLEFINNYQKKKMVFWRILDNKLYSVGGVDKLGFEKSEGLQISDEYLEEQEFTVMRTCHGLGDWGLISAIPRLLKEKYPNCKVYVPSIKLLEEIFNQYKDNWDSWDNPFQNVVNIFKNNPYIDGFKDNISGDVFHDHYRIYDNDNTDVSLVKQMLKFWQFTEEEMSDSQPEMYWSDEEKELGDAIIHEAADDSEFGCLIISERYDYSQDKLIVDKLKQYPLKYFYFTEKPIEQTEFDFIDKALDLRHIDMRIQLYIKSRAKVNIGNQCGPMDVIPRYSKTFILQRQFPISSNFIDGVDYLDNKNKRLLLDTIPDKFESKTTTTLKFKADLVDFLGNDFKDKNVIEIGCALGHTTHVLSEYFNKVTAVDLDPARIQAAKEFNKEKTNIDYIVKDVYGTAWDFDRNHQVVFIDCIHEYDYIRNDIVNSIGYFARIPRRDKLLLIFDDYGLFPNSVMKCIDEFIERGVLKAIKKIGHKNGVIFPNTAHKILKDYEGIICQVM